ncbi:MAG: Ku protein [Armatimonadetes bacterium]|nr:Ku protein [Armatimonadota bacterium]
MRATWSGMISFGLVNIPVRVYNAAREEKISFHQMHKEDSGRIGYQKVCKVCGTVVDSDEIINGYEYKKGHYVLLADEELDKINLNTTKAISIDSFVNSDEIDAVMLEETYYISPDENGEHAYVLLREALNRSGKVGIGKVTMRTREQLAAVRVVDEKLILETLHFADELTRADDLGIPGADVQLSENELELSQVLIEHMTREFDPAAYRNEYESAVKELINKKIEGEEVTMPVGPQATNVVDIVSALKASLAASESAPEPARKSA